MRISIFVIAFLFSFFQACDNPTITEPAEALENPSVMVLYLQNDDYTKLLNNKNVNAYAPVRITFQDKVFTGKIRSSGAGSRYYGKWSFKIELRDNERIHNMKEFVLHAQVFDPTFIRTRLTSHIFRQMGFPIFETYYHYVKINTIFQGLFLVIERMEEPFFERRGLPLYELYKAGFEASLTLKNGTVPEQSFDKDYPDNDSFYSLYELIEVLDTVSYGNETVLEKYIDCEMYLRFHIINTLINNVDGFTNNFLMYRAEAGDPFLFLPWDFDKTFFDEYELGLVGSDDVIYKLLRNEKYLKRYKELSHNIIDSVFTETELFPFIDSTAESIREAYNIDRTLGNGNYHLDEEIEKLKTIITKRRNYFIENIDSLQVK